MSPDIVRWRWESVAMHQRTGPSAAGSWTSSVSMTRCQCVVGGFNGNARWRRVAMGKPAEWMMELRGRAPVKSPGAPSLRRDVERWFWRRIGEGSSSEDAALAVGAPSAAGSRWFRERGGMPTFMLAGVVGAISVRGAGGDRAVEGACRRCPGDRSAAEPRRRRSLVSCAATPRLVAGSSITGRRSRSGRRS
jgi:hypothetical protein